MASLTRKQQQIYDFILAYIRGHGYPPSIREIGTAVGLKSPSTVHFHLKGLEKAGVIARTGGKTRAITLPHTSLVPVAMDPPRRVPVIKEADTSAPLAEETEPRANQVPVVGNVAAGSPILAQEYIEDYLTFDTQGRSGEHFALRVRGDSMVGAGILSGDLVVVHRQQEVYNGEIVVALFEDEATVKTYRRRDGHVWLMPENPEYEPIDGTFAQILGRVVAVVRRY